MIRLTLFLALLLMASAISLVTVRSGPDWRRATIAFAIWKANRSST